MVSAFHQFCSFISRLTHVPQQFIRFLIIGGLNTLFAYCIYALAICVGLHYTLAALAQTVLGTLFSFKTMGCLVFDNAENKLIFKFIAVYTLCYFLNIGFLRVLTQMGLSNLYIAGFISSALVALISFCLNKWVVFRKKAPADGKFIS